MKAGYIFAAAWIAVVLAGSAHGQFVPGHVFAAQAAAKVCKLPAEFGSDLIWEIDPETGQATLFVRIPPEMCGFITGLAFTPDGSRLRASMWLRDEILEFDSEGNMSVALDVSDGIACPSGRNNLAYDEAGNFYVLNQCTRNILRFPADGGPPTVFADATDGIGAGGAIAFAADGDLYLAHFFFENEVRRITPDGNASTFDSFGSIITPETVTGDELGHVYVGLETGEVFRYDAGNPASKELLAVFPIGGRNSMTMSPDQSKIYVNAYGSDTSGRLLGIDMVDGTVTTLAEFDDDGPFSSSPAGIAVVPIPPPPPIPTVSHWGMVILILLLLTAGTVLLTRRGDGTMRVRSRCLSVTAFPSPFDAGEL